MMPLSSLVDPDASSVDNVGFLDYSDSKSGELCWEFDIGAINRLWDNYLLKVNHPVKLFKIAGVINQSNTQHTLGAKASVEDIANPWYDKISGEDISCEAKTQVGDYCVRDALNIEWSYEPRILSEEKFSWIKSGVLPPVMNQGDRNTCWAHSLVGVIKSRNKIQFGEDVDPSFEELIIAFGEERYDYAYCGQLDDLFEYLARYGMCTKSTYDLWDKHKINEPQATYFLSGFEEIDINNEPLITAHLRDGPLFGVVYHLPRLSSLHKDATYHIGKEEYEITKETLRSSNQMELHHCVMIVGICEKNCEPVYEAQNSYGLAHADEGFFTIARGSSIKEGEINPLYKVFCLKGVKRMNGVSNDLEESHGMDTY